MSHAPITVSQDPTQPQIAAYQEANNRQQELLRNGVSNSGHERNCCFLNTGTGQFANISAAAGLDHIGDGRAYALVDWDHDGDLDVWATNRTGPRVQFLRNNTTGNNHFLDIRLQGNGLTTSRDAIGARVELVLSQLKPETRNPKSIKTVHAGEGFMGQSSKSLHFGLGPESRIDRLIVNWPGADTEVFTDLEADHFYTVVQGSGKASLWSRPENAESFIATHNEIAEPKEQSRIQLRYRIPLPKLEYQTPSGEYRSIGQQGASPTLINLWASWCQPCLKELVDFHERFEQLSAEGFSIVALSVDELDEGDASNPQAARAFLERQDFSFEAGFATSELIGKLEAAFYYLFDFRRPWAVPTSLLIDGYGQLSVIYIGAVDVDQLSRDIGQLILSDQQWFEASLPFAGRWTDENRHPNLTSLIRTYLDRGFAEDALQFVDRYADVLVADPSSSGLLLRLATSLRDQGDIAKATHRFQQAIESDPLNANAHFQLGRLLAEQGQFEDAARHCREAVQLRPDDADIHYFLANLLNSHVDKEGALLHFQRTVELRPKLPQARYSLGNAYAAKLLWGKASEQLGRAAELDPNNANVHYQLARVLQKSGSLEESISHFQQALELKPDSGDIHYSLGAALAALEKSDEAIEHLRQAHQLQSDSLLILNGLAWMLATQASTNADDRAEAVQLALKAAQRTKYKHPQILDTLATAYASNGQFDKAVSIANQAIQLATKSDSSKLISEIRHRLELYQQHRPYRESVTNK